MDRLHVLSGKDLLDGDHAVAELPEPLMWGENRYFVHQDPEVQAFRSSVRIYCGEYDFLVACMERRLAPDVDFTRFVANELRRRLLRRSRGSEPALSSEGRFQFQTVWHRWQLSKIPPLEETVSFVDSLPHRAPADVLWDFANFGCLLWDWKEKTLELLGEEGRPNWNEDVYARAAVGGRFLPRIFVNAPPELTESGTLDVLQRAMDGLAALPDIRKGLPRSEMEELIFNDVHALAALCSKHGTFGAAVLPGAFEPITGILLKVLDGNEREAFLETEGHYSYISLFTS
jgi:hypothetical protein